MSHQTKTHPELAEVDTYLEKGKRKKWSRTTYLESSDMESLCKINPVNDYLPWYPVYICPTYLPCVRILPETGDLRIADGGWSRTQKRKETIKMRLVCARASPPNPGLRLGFP